MRRLVVVDFDTGFPPASICFSVVDVLHRSFGTAAAHFDARDLKDGKVFVHRLRIAVCMKL